MFRSNSIGIALSGSHVTLVAIAKQGGARVLTQYLSESLPEEPLALPEAFETCVRAWALKRRAQRVHVGISSTQMVLRLLHMPPMGAGEMRQALAGEIEDYAVFAGSVPVFDYAPVPHIGGSPGSEVLIGALPQEFSQNTYHLLRRAGLNPVRFDLSHLAALRAVVDSQMLEPGHLPLMVLLVGADVSYAAGFRNGELFFLHPMDTGSRRLKEPSGVEELLHEFHLCWNSYHADFQDAQPFERVVVLADAPNLEALCEQLRQRVQLETIVPGDPRIHLTEIACPLGNWEARRFSAAAAIGLALSGLPAPDQPFQIRLNLLPNQVASLAQLRPQLWRLGWALAASLLLTLGGYLYYTSEIQELSHRQQRAERMIQELETSQLRPLLDLKREVGQLKRQLEQYEVFLSAHRAQRRSFLLHWLGRVMPRETWLSRFSCDEYGNVVFVGHSASQEGAFQFLDTVRQSPYFRAAQFTLKHDAQSPWAVSFTLRCKLQKDISDASVEPAL